MPWLMANLGESLSPDVHCVFVETNLNTRLAVLVHKDDTISHLKENLRKEHNQCFPEVGEIEITSFKVERLNHLYYISDSMLVSKVFEGRRSDCYAYVDAVRVENGELLSIMAADENHSEKKISNDTNDLSIEDGLETEVAEKSTKKKSMDGDDVLIGAISKDNESAEKNGISVQDIHKISDEVTLSHEITITIDDLKEAIEQDLGKGDKATELVKNDQEKDVANTLEPVDGDVISLDAVNESAEVLGELQVDVTAENCVILAGAKLDELLSGPIGKDNEGGEGSNLAPSSLACLQSAEFGASSGLATGSAPEKKKKRKRSSNVSSSTGPAPEKKKKKKSSEGSSSTGPAHGKKKKRKKSLNDKSNRSKSSISKV